mgnify:CR=1 FL=1
MKLRELFENSQYKIYCDLDGVLADFERGVKKLTGKYPHEQSKKDMWNAIYSIPNFFQTLDWIPEGRNLWNYIKGWNPTILTGLPASENGAQQKQLWCAEHLGRNVPVIVCRSADKQRYAEPNAILIDDRNDNIAQWKAQGGIGILHRTWPKTLNQLQKLGITPL